MSLLKIFLSVESDESLRGIFQHNLEGRLEHTRIRIP